MSVVQSSAVQLRLIGLFIVGCIDHYANRVIFNPATFRSVLTNDPPRKTRRYAKECLTISDHRQALDLANESGWIRWVGTERNVFDIMMLDAKADDLRRDPLFSGASGIADVYCRRVNAERPQDLSASI